MVLARCAPTSVFVALIATASTVDTYGCGGSSSPSPGQPSAPGVITVRGTERLAWNQVGDVSSLRFRAYVDDRGVSLDAAACDGATPEANCASPLPSLTDGTHTIALTAVSTFSGLESERSVPITVQKVSSRAAIGVASFPDAAAPSGSLRLETLVAAADDLVFAVDVVARGLQAPVQLAWAPDGRLLVAEADGRVRVVRPGEPDRGALALDARSLLEPWPAGSLGLAVHPEFARNHFVYLSFLAQDPSDQAVLRIVRLREVGDTLGEPATLLEARLTAAAPDVGGPRMAFGPDGLLYVALPPGVEFEREPAASVPVAAMLRLRDDGRVPEGMGPLTGVVAHPLGFAWHPSTGVPWLVFPQERSAAVVRPLAGGGAARVAEAQRVRLNVTEGVGHESRTLVFQAHEPGASGLVQVFAAGLEHDSIRTVRLAVPILAESLLAGWSGRIGDVAAGDGGTLFLAVGGSEDTTGAGGEEVIVRLAARRRSLRRRVERQGASR